MDLPIVAPPVNKWTGNFLKILLDQSIFASIYDVILFLSLGIIGGITDKVLLERTSNVSDRKQILQTYFDIDNCVSS